MTFEVTYFIISIGEMPAEKQSKGRWDSLLPDWGQIIAIEYYRVNDTLSEKSIMGACISYTGAFSDFMQIKEEIYVYKRTVICSKYHARVG